MSSVLALRRKPSGVKRANQSPKPNKIVACLHNEETSIDVACQRNQVSQSTTAGQPQEATQGACASLYDEEIPTDIAGLRLSEIQTQTVCQPQGVTHGKHSVAIVLEQTKEWERAAKP